MRHEITYRQPAVAGHELAVTRRVIAIAGVRATRRTTISSGEKLIADGLTEWVWVGNDGRPRRIPEEILQELPVA